MVVYVCDAASGDHAARCHHAPLNTTSESLSARCIPLQPSTATGLRQLHTDTKPFHTDTNPVHTDTNQLHTDTTGAVTLIGGCDWNNVTLYPATSSSAEQVYQFLNSAGQVQQFPAVLRMSSGGPSLLLTPTHSLPTSGPVTASEPVDVCPATQQFSLSVGHHHDLSTLVLQSSRPATDAPPSVRFGHHDPPSSVGFLPRSSVNAVFTAPTHLLPSGRHVIGCECCVHRTESPMTGVVCLQTPPLASH